jgi:hypothetical protein
MCECSVRAFALCLLFCAIVLCGLSVVRVLIKSYSRSHGSGARGQRLRARHHPDRLHPPTRPCPSRSRGEQKTTPAPRCLKPAPTATPCSQHTSLRTNLCTTSLQSVTDCSTVPGQGSVSYTRAGGQPAQRVSLSGKSTTNEANTRRRRRQACRISALNRTPKPRQDSCNLQHPPRIWKVINTTKEKTGLLAHHTGTAARKARQPNRFFPLPSLPYWLKPHFY